MPNPIVCRNPLYQQIKQILLDEIRQGVWKAGEQLPTEATLAERFGISVGTVRRALGGLEDEGIINRREGAGTFVRTYKNTGSANQFRSFLTLTANHEALAKNSLRSQPCLRQTLWRML